MSDKGLYWRLLQHYRENKLTHEETLHACPTLLPGDILGIPIQSGEYFECPRCFDRARKDQMQRVMLVDDPIVPMSEM